MTTCIGIKGYDPSLKEEYIMMASDSNVENTYLVMHKSNDTFKKYTQNSHDGIKILINKRSNLIVSTSGMNIYSDRSKFGKGLIEKFDSNYIKSIENLKYLKYNDINEVFSDLFKINKNFNNSFIVAENISNSLNLYSFNKNKKRNFSNSFFIGSGANIAYKEIDKKIKGYDCLKNLGYVFEIDKLLDITKNAFIFAKKEDEYTDGYINMTFPINSKKLIFKHIFNLNDNISFHNNRKFIVNNINNNSK